MRSTQEAGFYSLTESPHRHQLCRGTYARTIRKCRTVFTGTSGRGILLPELPQQEMDALGLYFRKSVNFGPFRVNLSKHGIGTSVGVPGFRMGRSATGRRYTSASLPGTGIRYVNYEKSRHTAYIAPQSPQTSPGCTGGGCMGCLLILLFALCVLVVAGHFSNAGM